MGGGRGCGSRRPALKLEQTTSPREEEALEADAGEYLAFVRTVARRKERTTRPSHAGAQSGKLSGRAAAG